MTLSHILCGALSTTLGGFKRTLLEAADHIGRLETAAAAVCEANNSCLSQSIPAASHHPIFTFDATQLLPLNSSNPVISMSLPPPPPPPPPPPIPTPCKTIFGPIFQVTPPATSATPTPHPAYMWMEQKSHTATELIESAWGNDRSSGVRNVLAWFRATVDSYSDYFLPMILIMLAFVLGYSIYVMVARVKRASAAGSGKAEADVDNPPKRLLRFLGSFIVSSLRLMASSVPYPVYLLAYIKAVKDMADIGFKFLRATWSDEWVRGGQQYLSWIGMEVDGLSNDFLRLVLAIVSFILVSRMCMVLSRIRRAGACRRDDAKVVIVGPNNSLKHRLCSLCTYLVSSLGSLVFSVVYLAVNPMTTVVCALNLVKLVFKGCIICIAWFFQSVVPRRTAAPASPIAASSPLEVTPPVEVSLPVPECGTPASDSLPASPSKVNVVDLQKLEKKYGEVKKVAGTRLVQGGKGKSPKKVAGASNLD